MTKITLPPLQQHELARQFNLVHGEYLQKALLSTAKQISILERDKELAQYAGEDGLNLLGKYGLRGELLFAIPSILDRNPKLLGYYRLLLGHSQKVFYTAATGLSRFKNMEETGIVSVQNSEIIPFLCAKLNEQAFFLAKSLESISLELLDHLTILSLGPQLRGGTNNKIGQKAIRDVFGIIHNILKNHLVEELSSDSIIGLKNASGRYVRIRFSSDPDIVIEEETSGEPHLILAVEIKGGTDRSNIHNRIGEAEKSHQKAKGQGFSKFWTIVNTSAFDVEKAKKESPTTNRFYSLADLLNTSSYEYRHFKEQIILLVGVPLKNKRTREKQ